MFPKSHVNKFLLNYFSEHQGNDMGQLPLLPQ